MICSWFSGCRTSRSDCRARLASELLAGLGNRPYAPLRAHIAFCPRRLRIPPHPSPRVADESELLDAARMVRASFKVVGNHHAGELRCPQFHRLHSRQRSACARRGNRRRAAGCRAAPHFRALFRAGFFASNGTMHHATRFSFAKIEALSFPRSRRRKKPCRDQNEQNERATDQAAALVLDRCVFIALRD